MLTATCSLAIKAHAYETDVAVKSRHHMHFFGTRQMLMKAVPLWSLCMTTSLAVLIESQSEWVWLGPSVRLSLALVKVLGRRGGGAESSHREAVRAITTLCFDISTFLMGPKCCAGIPASVRLCFHLSPSCPWRCQHSCERQRVIKV